MRFELSPGEIIDRCSVLKVKLEMLGEKTSIRKQHDYCLSVLSQLPWPRVEWYLDELYHINLAQWACNEQIIREQDRLEPSLLEDALLTVRNQRYCHHLNRRRNKIKNDATVEFGSNLIEEKSFACA